MIKSLKSLALVAALAIAASGARAAPFAVGQVASADATTCVIAFPSTAAAVETPVVVDATYGLPANGNRVCKVDVSSAAVGANTLTMGLKSTLWGVLGAATPFAFTRPDAAVVVIQLAP